MAEPKDITQIETYDTAQIYDQDAVEWTAGYLRVYKRNKAKKFFTAQSVSTTKVYSGPFKCAPYSDFSILFDIGASGVAGTLLVEMEVSEDGVKWYKKMDGLWGDLRWSGTAGNKDESVEGKVHENYARLTAIATAGTWTISATAMFNS